MDIISWNINGLDSCLKKGLLDYILSEKADFYCFQEVRTKKELSIPGYVQYWNLAVRKGYSGTLILARKEAISECYELGDESLDDEGRMIALEYDDFILINVYVPNSQSSLERLHYREVWDQAFYTFLTKHHKPAIVCGDFNVARAYIDIYAENLRNDPEPPGFLSVEREGMDRLLAAGYVDVFRYFHPFETGAYTWWSNRRHKRESNRGWRLDYFVISESLIPFVKKMEHRVDIMGSDHCPIRLKINLWRPPKNERLTEEELSEMWNGLDWGVLEEQLLRLQQSLTRAVFAGNDELRVQLQKDIVRSFAAKALAVRHVSNLGSAPGIDGLRWISPADKMRAARSLTSKGYRHQPYRRIAVTDGERTRYANVPTAYDKAMQVLYAYSLDPVAEATGDRKSFAFRKGRSMFDCHSYICKAFEGSNAPRYGLRGDVKSCYDKISHRWLLQNIPMDRKVLREILRAGAVFNGSLFPTERGISLGASLSPILGNMVLDGMQEYLYQKLYGDGERDFKNGNLIRYADDFIVAANSPEDAYRIHEIISDFLAQRGLSLSEKKTDIFDVERGFTFLSRTYQMRDGVLDVRPSAQAVADFERSLAELILPFRGSQKALILKINRKLSGWGNYHRVTNAHDAFRRIDAVVQSLLVRHARSLHPSRQWGHIMSKYWYKDGEGAYVYALQDNHAIQVAKLTRAVIVEHVAVKTNFNPYLDQTYYQNLIRRRDIEKVSGAKLRGIWTRQEGRCYYCGQPMLSDHEITLAPIRFGLSVQTTGYAYVHRLCYAGHHEQWEESDAAVRPINVLSLLDKVVESSTDLDDPYYPLREFFRICGKSPLTLSFEEIESILGERLDWEAYFCSAFWYDEAPGFGGEMWSSQYPFQAIRPGNREHCISEAWRSQGYVIQHLRLTDHRVVFRKDIHGTAAIKVPRALMDTRIPKDAVFELEEFFKYIIRKYGLGRNS